MTTVVRRRTQAERTAGTRALLLDATVETLVELGYAGTTTTEVTRRARLSPGALLHHFPTKRDLLVAAMNYLFERRLTEFRLAMAARDRDADRLDSALDLLWSMFAGPTFVAWVELRMAARTDPDLAAAVLGLDEDFQAASEEIARDLFADDPVMRDPQFLRTALTLTFTLLDGLALGNLLPARRPVSPEQILGVFKALVRDSLARPQEVPA